MELDSTEAILSGIEAGLGVGFVSEWAIVRRAAYHSLVSLRLSGRTISRTLSLLLPQGPELQGPPRSCCTSSGTQCPRHRRVQGQDGHDNPPASCTLLGTR
jgi:hypothetical protein